MPANLNRRLILKHAKARSRLPQASKEVWFAAVLISFLVVAGGWLFTLHPSLRAHLAGKSDGLMQQVHESTDLLKEHLRASSSTPPSSL